MTSITKITIYGKSYNVKTSAFSVPPEEVAAFVDQKMQDLSGSPGKPSTLDLAILAALNIAHEFLGYKENNIPGDIDLESRLDALIEKVEKVS
jgi:cell division protein ZapA (FtsZ GTPase activity inhibitor)